MDKIVMRIANLITVKSILTLILTIFFAILSFRGDIKAESFVSIFTMVVSFYFGTQYEKKAE